MLQGTPALLASITGRVKNTTFVDKQTLLHINYSDIQHGSNYTATIKLIIKLHTWKNRASTKCHASVYQQSYRSTACNYYYLNYIGLPTVFTQMMCAWFHHAVTSLNRGFRTEWVISDLWGGSMKHSTLRTDHSSTAPAVTKCVLATWMANRLSFSRLSLAIYIYIYFFFFYYYYCMFHYIIK
jgi:hypothetical protein